MHQDVVDDDIESQRGHGQIVPRQPERRHADDQGGEGYPTRREGHGDPWRKPAHRAEDGGAVRPQAEECCMAQRDLAGVSDEEVEAKDDDGVDRDEV
jgi:hypothetical protein